MTESINRVMKRMRVLTHEEERRAAAESIAWSVLSGRQVTDIQLMTWATAIVDHLSSPACGVPPDRDRVLIAHEAMKLAKEIQGTGRSGNIPRLLELIRLLDPETRRGDFTHPLMEKTG